MFVISIGLLLHLYVLLHSIFSLTYTLLLISSLRSHHSTNIPQLLLLDILLTAGIPWTLIALTIFLDWVMIITGLVGALTSSSYKWGYFVFAMLALFGITYNVLWTAREYAGRLGPRVDRTSVV